MAKDAPPFLLADFAAEMARLPHGSAPALAVSGGGDSMALLALAAKWASGAGVALRAFTVDHGLRPEAAAEAALAAEVCGRFGIPHRTLRWTDEKPQTGLQAAARAARYRLMLAAAGEGEASALLTAHTQDDQAETLFLRLCRGAGPEGLAAMTPTRLVAAGAGAPLPLLRPLLGASRASLRAVCTAEDVPFAEDPSNTDPAFERVRVRGVLAGLAAQGIVGPADLVRAAARAQASIEAQARRVTADFAAAGGVIHPQGYVQLSEAGLSRLHPDDGAAMLASAIHAVSGAEHAPDAGDARRMLVGEIRTLSGVLATRAAGRLVLSREPAALSGRRGADIPAGVRVEAGAPVLWDRRFIVTSGKAGVLRALGEAAGTRAQPSGFPAAAGASLPGLFSPEGDLIAAPDLRAPAQSPHMDGLKARFLGRERFERRVVRF